MKITGQIVGILGTAMVLSITLYYFSGGTAYINALGTAVPKFVKGVENFQGGYPAAAKKAA